jgi:mRNA interferase MazF
VSDSYVPDIGHIIWIQLNPQAGHEQAGHRPALVLSPSAYNDKTSLAIVCPITKRPKGYPFEVPIENDPQVAGAVLSDQVKCLDWRARGARHKGTASPRVVDAVKNNLAALIDIQGWR